MKYFQKLLIITSLLAFTTACENAGPNGSLLSKENIGTLVGAAGGAAVGSQVGKGKGQIVGIAAGTLLGAMAGKAVGASLDRADLAYYEKTSQSALEKAPTGQASSWSNPDSGNSGTITPVKTYETAGIYCREYRQTINVGGKVQEGYGTACRQPDGSWKIKE